MNHKKENVGAIFCGGKSTRMGQPKEVMQLKNGKTLIENVFDAIEGLCSQIVLVGTPQIIPQRLTGLKQISDNFENIGPIGGLEALLSSGLSKQYLIIPCDLDQVTKEVLEVLLDIDGERPIVFRQDNKLEPLIGLYDQDLLPIIQEKINLGLYSLKGVLQDVKHTEVDVPQRLRSALNNVNSLCDFK